MDHGCRKFQVGCLNLEELHIFGDLDWLIQIDQSENADTWPFTDLIG